MSEPKPLKPGDKCPNDGAELLPARVPTEDERRLFEDREIRQPLPGNSDTMSAKGREEHGALYRCPLCGYNTRFPLSDADTRAKAPA